MLSHVSARRVRSVQKLLKMGKQEMMEVIRVDEDKMCIDLSKKSMKPDAVDEARALLGRDLDASERLTGSWALQVEWIVVR